MSCLINLSLVLFFLTPSFVFAQERVTIPNLFATNDNISESLLVNFPGTSKENLRMMLPENNWIFGKYETAKGRYLKIRISYPAEKLKINIFKDLDFNKNPPAFNLENHVLNSSGDKKCEWLEYTEKVTSSISQFCRPGICTLVNERTPKGITNYKGLRDGFYSASSAATKQPKDCDLISYFKIPDRTIDTEYIGIHIDAYNTKHAEIMIAGKKHYFDTSFCSTSPNRCELVVKKYSPLEIAWMNKENVVKKRSYEKLNYLIEKLLPCVKKKDKACISKFFITSEEADAYDQSLFVQPKDVQITDETIKDLEYCLDYNQLLPYGGRMKALGDRICILSPEQFSTDSYKIHSITLPDAFKTYQDSTYVNYEL